MPDYLHSHDFDILYIRYAQPRRSLDISDVRTSLNSGYEDNVWSNDVNI